MSVEEFGPYRVARRPDQSLWEIVHDARSVTYRADDTHLGRTVSLRVLRAEHSGRQGPRGELLAEARLAGMLNSPRIVTVYHLEDAADRPYYAAEYAAGEPLPLIVQHLGGLNAALALTVLDQCAEALEEIERVGAVHHRLEPVGFVSQMRHDRPSVKLADLTVAEAAPKQGRSAFTRASEFSLFASPEQRENIPLDISSNIFSLGLILYFLLKGVAPPLDRRRLIPRQELRGLPPRILALLERMLVTDFRSRLQNVAQLREAIGECIGAGHAHAHEAGPQEGHPDERLRVIAPTGAEGNVFVAETREDKQRVLVHRFGQAGADPLDLLDDARKLNADPHPNLLCPVEVQHEGSHPYAVYPERPSIKLIDVMRRCGALRLDDAMPLIEQIAAGIDHAVDRGIVGLDIRASAIEIVFEDGLPEASFIENPPRDPRRWPTFTVQVPTLKSSGQRVDPAGNLSALDRIGAAGTLRNDALLVEFAWVVYELLGGSRASATMQAGRYAPLAALSEGANGVLRRVVTPGGGEAGFASALAVVAGLAATVRAPGVV